MARKVGKRDNRLLAKLVVENRAPCAFCNRDFDDEISYGKLYAIGSIQCHYYCVLLSCCLVQKGPEDEGLFGFMYKDILTELERSKKHKCSYCCRGGANLGCSVTSCRKQFHLPCGRERNAVSLYYGTYKSFCQLHAPKQTIPEHIMSKVRLRKKAIKTPSTQSDEVSEDMVCVICYEAVEGGPSVNTFWPPCCRKDEWFHRTCLQRMALSAGMHYLKCPLCNDKQNFYDAVISQGYYVPDRDAAWELEQNAFAEIYERPLTCTAEVCQCPLGRDHDADQGLWDIKLCLLCGSVGAHAQCIGASETTRYVCLTCTPAAPEDLQALADVIEKMILDEQAASAASTSRGPVMPSRMSIRRTKGRHAFVNRPTRRDVKTECENLHSEQTISSRQELNLTTPRKPIQKNNSPYQSPAKPNSYKPIHSTPKKDPYKKVTMLSPMRLLEQSFNEKICMGVNSLDESVVEMLRTKFKKPGPFKEKKRIVNDIINGLFNNQNTSEKNKEILRQWCSPKKVNDVIEENTNEIAQNLEVIKESAQETPRKITRSSKNKSLNEKVDNSDNKTDKKVKNKQKNKKVENKNLHKESSKGKQNLTNKSEELIENEESNNNINHPKGESCKETDQNCKTESKSLIIDKNKRNKKDFSSEETIENATMIVQDIIKSNSGSIKSDSDIIKSDSVIIKSDSDIPNKSFENDESSSSTFQLPSDFIADTISDASNSVFYSPCKAIHSNNPNFNAKSEVSKENKCAFKFSPLNTEKLNKKNIDIDLESFKNSYLNEVGKESDKNVSPIKDLRSIKDTLVTHMKEKMDYKKKRKLSEDKLLLVFPTNSSKKRKLSELNLDFGSSDDFEEKELNSSSKKKNKIKVKISPNRRNKQKHEKESKEKSHKSETPKSVSVKENNSANDDEINSKDSDSKLNKINKTATDNESVAPKRKLHESSQWMNEITQLDKKLEKESKRKTDKKESRSKAKGTEDVSSINKSFKCSEDNVKDNRKVVAENSKLFNNVKNIITEKDTIEKDEKIVKEIRQAKRDKKLKSKQRRHKSDKLKKDKKYRNTRGNSKKDHNIELTIDSSDSKSKKTNKKIKTKLSITEKDISVKIKWKKKQLQLKIESKKEKIENDHSKFKQYVLQYFSEITPKDVLVKPETEVTPLKRKYTKQEKTPDNLKQMSIQNFFKTKSPIQA